jgi:hypothetical protein
MPCQNATTFSIMTITNMTLSIITIKMQYKDTEVYRKIYNSQHNILLRPFMLNVSMKSFIMLL